MLLYLGIIENRFRTRGKQSVFQKNLEKLKRDDRLFSHEHISAPAHSAM